MIDWKPADTEDTMLARRLVQTSQSLYLTERVSKLLGLIQSIPPLARWNPPGAPEQNDLSNTSVVNHPGDYQKDPEHDCTLSGNQNDFTKSN